MQKIDVSSILKETGNKLVIDFTENIDFKNENLYFSEPIKIHLALINTGKSILASGNVSSKLLLPCDRCLEEFPHPLAFEIEEQFCKGINEYKNMTGEFELTEEDFFSLIKEDNTIDLYEILRQNIITNIPIKALCRLDCPGIYVKREKAETIDPRLVDLKKLINNK